ncbi:MAG: M14 family metallopeptidase [Lachnospiraceae bacterium]
MIQEVASVEMSVHERMTIKKNRLQPEVLTGKEKRFSLVTGIHGDELDGQYICYEVIRRINEHPEYLTGIVDVYPAINPLGVDTGVRGIPMFDLDMNRVFPGSENGAMAEYAAAKVVGDIIGSDLCLDLHSSNIFIKEIPQVRVNEENAGKLLPYAKMLNADLVWIYSSITVLDATLAYSLNKMGVPALVAEMGVGLRIDNELCQQMIDGIFNLMKELGIWQGETKPVRDPLICLEGDVSVLRSEVTGIFVRKVDGLGSVEAGTCIGEIIEPISGTVLQSFAAPTAGFVFTLREHPVVYRGDIIARVHGGLHE